MDLLSPLLRRLSLEDGATASEYAIVVTLIAVAVIGTVTFVGLAVLDLLTFDWPS